MNDRFKMPKPTFIQPSKPLIATDGSFKRDTTPSKPLRAPLPALNLPTFGNEPPKEKKTRPLSEPKGIFPKVKPVLIKFGPEHVLTDEEFIIQTRAFNIHDEGMKEIFFANGGEEIVDGYATLAQAFDSLRRQKQAKINGVKAEEYRRFQPKNPNEKVYVPGMASDAEVARERAKEAARFRAENENWIRQPIERRTA